MKNILFLSAFLWATTNNIFAQIMANPHIFAAENKLNNAVKTITINTLYAKGTAKNYSILQPKRNTPPIKWILDKEGKFLELQQLDLAAPDFITLHHTYNYNLQNELNTIQQLEPSQQLIKKNTYNNEGKLISQVVFYPEKQEELTTTFEYTVDKNEAITLMTTIDKNKKPYNVITLRRDSKGNIIEEKYKTTQITETQTKQFTYNDKAQLIELKQFDYREKPINQVNYKYDEKGNVIEYKQSSADGNISTIFTYIYKYDEKGNWIERVEIEKGFAYVAVQRIITYHE